MTLRRDALSWPWEEAPAASRFIFLGESLAGEPCACLGRLAILLLLLGVASGPAPSPTPGPMHHPSSITGPTGKRSFCFFPPSVLCCLLQGVGKQFWAAGQTLVLGHGWARATRGVWRSGSNPRSPAQAAAVARAGQSDPEQVPAHHHCGSFFLATHFRSNQKKPCYFTQL